MSIDSRSFVSKYRCNKLIYFENSSSIIGAIAREKEIKGWRREKKIFLINFLNPEWKDLSEDFY